MATSCHYEVGTGCEHDALDRYTHKIENITFLQLRCRVVMIDQYEVVNNNNNNNNLFTIQSYMFRFYFYLIFIKELTVNF